MATRADRAGMLQRLCHPDGRLHVIAASHAGQLPHRPFLVAGILGRPDGVESRVDAAVQRSRRRPRRIQRRAVDRATRPRLFDSADGDVGSRSWVLASASPQKLSRLRN